MHRYFGAAKLIAFACPQCHGILEPIHADELRCVRDDLVFRCEEEIWRFLLPPRQAHFAQFTRDYEAVRRFEGHGATSPKYYRALPFRDLSGALSREWSIRAASFVALQKVIDPERAKFSPFTAIDLGAGNCWLSNRLALDGCDVVALDLLTNSADGLGARAQYQSHFTAVQAEYVRLPFQNAAASAVIFNASFHYAEDYGQVLAEALRVLHRDGVIIVMDSPAYHSASSGEQRVVERAAAFRARYGFESDSVASKNFFTYDQMHQLAARFDLRWRQIKPFYGVRWMLRPLIACLRNTREPAEFGLWVARKPRD